MNLRPMTARSDAAIHKAWRLPAADAVRGQRALWWSVGPAGELAVLLVHRRANAVVFSASGTPEADFCIGDDIPALVTDADGGIWTAYGMIGFEHRPAQAAADHRVHRPAGTSRASPPPPVSRASARR